MTAIPNLFIPGVAESATSFLLSCLSVSPDIYTHEIKEMYFGPQNSYQKSNSLYFSLLVIEFIEEMVDNEKRNYSSYLRFKTLNRLIYSKNARTLAKRYNKLPELREKRNTSYININKTDLS